jgi:hypothetical protein
MKFILWFIVILWLIWRLILEIYVYKLDKKEKQLKKITIEEHQNIVKSLCENFPQIGSLSLKPQKDKHVFGLKNSHTSSHLSLDNFTNLIQLEDKQIHVQGNVNIYQLLQYLIAHDKVLQCIPDMDHLTIGGLYSGIGGGAATFRYGAFYSSVKQIEMIKSNGDVVICNETQNEDLFRLMPSSLGTLGYVLSFWIDIIPAKKYVESSTHHFTTFSDFLQFLNISMDCQDIDFLDGTIFNSNDFVVIQGSFRDDITSGCKLSKNKLETPYYEMIQRGFSKRFSSLHDFIYRFDCDGYFSEIGMPNIVRNPFARQLLFHEGLMRGSRLRPLFCAPGQIQGDVSDFMIPWAHANEYFDCLVSKNLALYPIYICPITFISSSPFIKPAIKNQRAIDFGLGYGVNQNQLPHRDYIRKCMQMAYSLNGDMLKYISIYNKDEFWEYYDKCLHDEYKLAKKNHDPSSRLLFIEDKLHS